MRRRFPWLAPVGVLVALLLAACAGAPAPTPTPTASPAPAIEPTGNVGGRVGDRAPEFKGITGWVNSDPLTMESLRGKVVLFDFWTYTCVNCLRTLPYIREWHARYADRGLVIVGVHAPEFEFEKVTANVVKASRDFGLRYPVAQDNDFATWSAYGNRYWPSKYLVDKDGFVAFTHFGEGAYAETEEKIRELLTAAGADLSGVPAANLPEPVADPRAYGSEPETRVTRELYGGFLRNHSLTGLYVADARYYDGPDQVLEYTDPGRYLNHHIYLQGLWRNGAEALHHARATANHEDYIVIKLHASSVNAVIEPRTEVPFDVRVVIDGHPLTPDEAGEDMTFIDGHSIVRVTEPRMYSIVTLDTFEGHELKLSSNSESFSLFAFTFGAYVPQ